MMLMLENQQVKMNLSGYVETISISFTNFHKHNNSHLTQIQPTQSQLMKYDNQEINLKKKKENLNFKSTFYLENIYT